MLLVPQYYRVTYRKMCIPVANVLDRYCRSEGYTRRDLGRFEHKPYYVILLRRGRVYIDTQVHVVALVCRGRRRPCPAKVACTAVWGSVYASIIVSSPCFVKSAVHGVSFSFAFCGVTRPSLFEVMRTALDNGTLYTSITALMLCNCLCYASTFVLAIADVSAFRPAFTAYTPE